MVSYTFQQQVLVGTVLGGSSLVRPPNGVNYYLSMRDGNEKWLRYKTEEMPEYYQEPSVRMYSGTFRCNSCCLASLTEMYGRLYRDGRRLVTGEILDPLMNIGLAVWYLDGGGKTGRDRKNAYVNTTKFGAGAAVVEDYFNQCGFPCHLGGDGDRSRVLFTVGGTEGLFRTIEDCVPDCMLHRL